MKHILILLSFCVLPFIGSTQLTIGYTNNFDVYKPYTEEAQDYMKHNDKVYSNTWSIYAQYPVIRKPKWSLAFGLSYKNIRHVIEDKFLYYSVDHTYKDPNGGWHTVTLNFKDPTDLISVSRNFGLNGEFRYHLFSNSKFSGQIGLNSEVYVREQYKSEYEKLETNQYNAFIDFEPLVSEIKKFYLASSNLSVFYRHTWQFSPFFSLGAKVNVGTNVSSDWDQFRKYVWLGAGLELGFGKVKTL